MSSLFQSAFLQSLGFAIANSLWQTAIIWLLYLSVSHIFRFSSAAKYRMAVTAQLVSFAWFVITIQFYYSQYTEALRNSSVLLPSSQNIQAVIAGDQGFTSQLIRLMVKTEQVLPYISMAYLLLILFLAIRWISGYRQTQILRTQGLQKIPVDWRLFVKKIASQLGIKKDIRLFLSENITTPLTIGFLKPVILIPVASINHLTTQQLEAVLLHELAHIRRYDYIVNIILSAVEIGLFFNPFTQLLSKSIRKERENSCDDWVLQFEYKASDYAEALLRIAYLQQIPAFARATADKPAFAMGAAGKKNDLLVRVKRMIGEKDNRFNYRRQLMALVMVTGMLGCIAWLNPVVPANENKQNLAVQGKPLTAEQKQTVAVEPMTVKIDNPLFNPVFFLSEPLKKEMEKNLASAKEEIAALVTPGGRHEGLIGSIPPMVAHALEKAAFAFDEKSNRLELEVAGMEKAKKNFEKLVTDSFANAQAFSFMLNNELVQSWNGLQLDLEKTKDDLVKLKQLKKQSRFDAAKVKKDLRYAVDELAKLDLDKIVMNSLEIAGMFSGQEFKTKEPKKPAAKKSEDIPLKKIPAPEIPADLFLKISIPEIHIDGENISVQGIRFTPTVLKELAELALQMQYDVSENLSSATQKNIRLRFEKLVKSMTQKSKVINTVCTEEEKEEGGVVIRMQ